MEKKMNQVEFNSAFERLCGNYNKKPKDVEAKGTGLYGRFGNYSIKEFEKVMDRVMDREKFFPTISHFVTVLNTSKKGVNESEYPHCKVCNNNVGGFVSMIERYEFKDGKRRIVEKYHWSLEKQIELRMRNNGVEYYDVSYSCRCPKGIDLHNARDENPPLIKPEEFEELKHFNSGV